MAAAKKKCYFIVTFTDGRKIADYDLTQAAAKALYEFFNGNMIDLKVQRTTWGVLDA